MRVFGLKLMVTSLWHGQLINNMNSTRNPRFLTSAPAPEIWMYVWGEWVETLSACQRESETLQPLPSFSALPSNRPLSLTFHTHTLSPFTPFLTLHTPSPSPHPLPHSLPPRHTSLPRQPGSFGYICTADRACRLPSGALCWNMSSSGHFRDGDEDDWGHVTSASWSITATTTDSWFCFFGGGSPSAWGAICDPNFCVTILDFIVVVVLWKLFLIALQAVCQIFQVSGVFNLRKTDLGPHDTKLGQQHNSQIEWASERSRRAMMPLEVGYVCHQQFSQWHLPW